MFEPPVMICLATYNGGKYIEEQLQSLLKQTYSNWTAIISDDGSSDDTLSILNLYCNRHPEHFSIIENERPHVGAKANFSLLLNKAPDTYIMFCDQDDIWNPDKIQMTLDEMHRQEDDGGLTVPALVFTDLQPVDASLKPLCESYMRFQNLDPSRVQFNHLLVQNVVTGCTVMINNELRQLFRCWAEDDRIIMHDWWLALIAAQFGKVCYLPRASVKYRQHGGNAIGASKSHGMGHFLQKVSDIAILRKKVLRLKAQAELFEITYRDRLSEKTIRLINRFKQPHSGLWFYIGNQVLMHGALRNIGLLLLG